MLFLLHLLLLDTSSALAPIGFKTTTAKVGGETVPVSVWYPTTEATAPAADGEPPYQYQIAIGNLFRAFLGIPLPIPAPKVASGDSSIVPNATPAETKGGVIFAHGMLGSRYDMATLCERLAREGFAVSAADFAESISAPFKPNEETTRINIINAERDILAELGAKEYGIVGHSAGGGSATTAPGSFALGRCAVAGAREYQGSDPVFIVASAGDGVIPIDKVRMAVPSSVKPVGLAKDLDFKRSRSAALIIDEPVLGGEFLPNHISFLDEEANAALVKFLSPLLPLARFLRLPVLDFDVYTERLDADVTATAVRPSIVEFFVEGRKRVG